MSIQVNLKVLIARKEQETRQRLSYEQLGQQTGLSKTTLHSLAAGRTAMVRFDTLDKLCKFFNCDVGDVLYYVPHGERD
jgi:putative transcriptional regulator